MRSILPTVLAAALLAPASAVAAPPWSPAAPLGGTQPLTSGATLLTTAAGTTAAIDDEDAGTRGSRIRVAILGPSAFTTPTVLTVPDTSYGSFATYGQTGLVAAGTRQIKAGRVAVLAFGSLTSAGARLRAPVVYGPGAKSLYSDPVLAVDHAGDVAMAFSVCRDEDCEHELLYLTSRRAGSTRLTSTRLADAEGRISGIAVALNGRGDALVAWQQEDLAHARLRTAGGRLRPTRTVGTMRNASHPIAAALSPHDGELVGWTSQSIDEGFASAGVTSVAQAREDTAFRRVQLTTLPPGDEKYVSGDGVDVAFDPHGRRLIAWTGYDAATHRYGVRTGELHGAANGTAATLVDPVQVSDPSSSAILASSAVDASEGQRLAIIAGPEPTDAPGNVTQLLVASRAAGASGPFTLEAVSDRSSDVDHAIDGASTLTVGAGVVAAWSTEFAGDFLALRQVQLSGKSVPPTANEPPSLASRSGAFLLFSVSL